MDRLNIVYKNLSEIRPYERNPRKNDKAVEFVANSIREFGFKTPIVVDAEGIIVAGHTRYRAATELGLEEVPCIIADDLTDEQIRAYRLADNKTAEISEWDYLLLDEELEDILSLDMDDFGFGHDKTEIEWDDVEDLDVGSYEEPDKVYLRCPSCQHIDTTTHFVKVSKPEESA